MSSLNPAKLHVRFFKSISQDNFELPRRYTLTHSDATGDLFLVIGKEYDFKAISGWYTRLMRDEVLGEWLQDRSGLALHIYCHVSGGISFGLAGWRNNILVYHMPQVIQAIRFGDGKLFINDSTLDQYQVFVHFQASRKCYDRVENYGMISNYVLTMRKSG